MDLNSRFAYHNCEVVTVGVRQGSIAAQHKVLDFQKVLQIAGMISDYFCHMVQFSFVHKSLFQAVLKWIKAQYKLNELKRFKENMARYLVFQQSKRRYLGK